MQVEYSQNTKETTASVTELELLCVSWAIEHFCPYLYGQTFQIITDHKAITTVMKMKKPTSKITRMLLQLQEYDYYFTFRPGKLHQAADALTRLPAIDDTEDAEEILLLESANELFYSNPETNLSENDQLEFKTIQSAGNCSSNELSISLQEFQIEQRKDPDLHRYPVFQFLENNELTGDYKTDVQTIAWSR